MRRIILDVEMMDGTVHDDLRVVQADMIRHADVSRRHKWGGIEDDPIRAMTFFAYAAMTRLGLYPADKGFDQYVTDVAMVDDGGDEPVDPTE